MKWIEENRPTQTDLLLSHPIPNGWLWQLMDVGRQCSDIGRRIWLEAQRAMYLQWSMDSAKNKTPAPSPPADYVSPFVDAPACGPSRHVQVPLAAWLPMPTPS